MTSPQWNGTASVVNLAQLFKNKEIDLTSNCDLHKTKEKLLSVKGIGPCTTDMIALRCLREPNAYPKSDLILKRVHEKFNFDPEILAPWRSYAAIGLWKSFAQTLSRSSQKKRKK